MELFSEEHDLVRLMAEEFITEARNMGIVKDCEDQIRASPHPVFTPCMDVCLDVIEDIKHERTKDLLHSMIILMFWKMTYSSSFRPPAIAILEKLSKVLPELNYVPYKRDPNHWSVNRYEQNRKKRERLNKEK